MSPGVDALVSDIARRIEADLPALTVEMTDHFVEVIPEFTHDDAVRRLMVASTSANLVTIVDLLGHGIAPERIAVPAAAAEYARRFAQRHLSLEALLRAYRLGEHRLLQWALRYLAELEVDAGTAIATTQRLAQTVHGYIDHVIEGLIAIYEQERQRWDRRSDTARAARLRAVLAADDLDTGDAEELVGRALGGWHLAAVAWVDAGVPDSEPDLRGAARLLREAYGQEPLVVLADDHTLWAWVGATPHPATPHPATPGPAAPAGVPGVPAPVRVPARELARGLAELPRLRMVLGDPGRGLAGFRRSHRQALRARAVVEMAPHRAPLVEFREVAITALLAESLPDLRAWVDRSLGELARDDEAMARLRDTVRVFLACGGSYTDAAARLHLHKNTVLYRLRRAERALPAPLAEHRLEVEVALLACAQLGLPTLDAPPG